MDNFTTELHEGVNELKSLLEESVQKSKTALDDAGEDDLLPDWTMRNSGQVLMVGPSTE